MNQEMNNMRSDEELKDLYKVEIEDGGVFSIAFLEHLEDDDENVRRTELLVQEALALLEANKDKDFNVLCDVSTIEGGFLSMPKRSMELYKSFVEKDQVKKVAVFGSTYPHLTIANFVLNLKAVTRKIKWFSSEEEARLYLDTEADLEL